MEIAIDLGKWKSYVVMEDNGKIVKEGYTETTKDTSDRLRSFIFCFIIFITYYKFHNV